jgi:methionine-rich copper-binding protein CopC
MAGLALAWGLAAAHAHAFLEQTDPRAGSTVTAAPAELRLWFSESLEPAFSSVEVTDGQGRRVEGARGRVDVRDPALVRAPLPRLGPGTYTATWRAVSIDTHVTEGRFVFHVAP